MTVKIVSKGDVVSHAENPQAGIGHFHWSEDHTPFTGVYSRDELYKFIKQGNEAYIMDPTDKTSKARIYLTPAKTKSGACYVCDKVEGKETQYLLNLPDCE